MIHIDPAACKGCGLCGEICPRRITEVISNNVSKRAVVVEERADLCMRCGHCMAICKTGAITVDDLEPAAFGEPLPLELNDTQLLTLLQQRRSVRRYKSQRVPRKVLERIVEGAHASPTGTGSMSTGIIVVDRRELIEGMMKHTYQVYAELDRALGSFVGRFIVRRKAGEQNYRMLQSFVMPGMRWYLRWREEDRSDEISRDCPALLLFHGPSNEPMVSENCTIAAFHAILMAECLEVGSCFNHLIPPACNRSPTLRAMLGLPDDREVYDSITLGYPRYKWRRTVPRRLAEVRFLE